MKTSVEKMYNYLHGPGSPCHWPCCNCRSNIWGKCSQIWKKTPLPYI